MRRLDRRHWEVVLTGATRWRLPVLIEVGDHTWGARLFLLRGPERRRGDPAGLHAALLRRNGSLRLCRLSLDGDGDVVASSRLPLSCLDGDTLGELLAELLSIGDGAFEGMVHTGYPGVFPPLPRRH